MTMPVNIFLIKTLLSIYEILVGRAKNMATVLQMVLSLLLCCTSNVSNYCITANAAGLRPRISVWGDGAIDTPLQQV